jgi:hypothetical protein
MKARREAMEQAAKQEKKEAKAEAKAAKQQEAPAPEIPAQPQQEQTRLSANAPVGNRNDAGRNSGNGKPRLNIRFDNVPKMERE